MTSKPKNFYRRVLPDKCIDFSSKQGRVIFERSLRAGYLECYFKLAAQFRTQEEPAYCGLSTLVMVLNTLAVDPGRVWKGVFRWYHEEMLDCCAPLEVIKKQGITAQNLQCLAKCNQLHAEFYRANEDSNVNEFRKIVKEYSQSEDKVIILSYGRQVLGQTGSGHFSPVAGYDEEEDLVLILDVARFKYPPYWVKLKLLYESMKTFDTETGKCRGFMLLQRSSGLYNQPPILFSLAKNLNVFNPMHQYIQIFFDTTNEFLKQPLNSENEQQNLRDIAIAVLKASCDKNDKDAIMHSNFLSLRITENQIKSDFPEMLGHIKLMTSALENTKFFQTLLGNIPSEICCQQAIFTPNKKNVCCLNNQGEKIFMVCPAHFISMFLLSFPLKPATTPCYGDGKKTYSNLLCTLIEKETAVLKQCKVEKEPTKSKCNCNCLKDDSGSDDTLSDIHKGRTLLLNEINQLKTQFMAITDIK